MYIKSEYCALNLSAWLLNCFVGEWNFVIALYFYTFLQICKTVWYAFQCLYYDTKSIPMETVFHCWQMSHLSTSVKTMNSHCTWLEEEKSEQKVLSTYHGYPSDETLLPVSLNLQCRYLPSPPFVSSAHCSNGTDTKAPNLSYLRGILVEIRSAELRKMGILNIASVSGSGILYVSMAITGDLELYTSKDLLLSCGQSLRSVAVKLWPKVCFSGASLDSPTLVGYLELLVWTVMTCYHWQTWRTWSVHSKLPTPPPSQLRFQQAVVTDMRHSACGWSAEPYKTVQFSRLIWSSLIRVSLMYI